MFDALLYHHPLLDNCSKLQLLGASIIIMCQIWIISVLTCKQNGRTVKIQCMIVNAFLWIGQIRALSKLVHPAPSPHQISWCCCAMHSVHTASSNVHTVQIGFWQKRSGLRLKIFVCAQFGKPTIGPKSDKLVWILVKYAQVHQYLIDKSAAQLYVVYIGTNSMTNMSLSVLQILMTYT